MTSAGQGTNLSATELSWAPKGRRKLIDGIGFSLAAGERLAIVGPGGAGKSTLLRLLNRAFRPKLGEIRLGGENIWAIKPNVFAREVAMVLQESEVALPFSVRDVVQMGRIPWRRGLGQWTNEDRAETHRALEYLDLVDLALRQYPTLSGGERQRVLIARALAQRPKLLILDAFQTHLDTRQQREFLNLLGGLGITVIAILHDIDLATGFATRAAVMKDGRMIAFGATEQVLTRDTITAAFAGVERSPSAPGGGRFKRHQAARLSSG